MSEILLYRIQCKPDDAQIVLDYFYRHKVCSHTMSVDPPYCILNFIYQDILERMPGFIDDYDSFKLIMELSGVSICIPRARR